MNDARMACRAGWTPRARGLVRRRTGYDAPDPAALVDLYARQGLPSLDAIELGALDRVIRAHEFGLLLSDASVTFVQRTLAPLGAYVAGVPHPDLLHQLAAASLPDADAAAVHDLERWWSGTGDPDADGPTLRVDRAAALRTRLAMADRSTPGPQDVRAAADRIRGALLGPRNPRIPPLAVALGDDELCTIFVVGSKRIVRDADALVAAWIEAVNREPAAALTLARSAHDVGVVAAVAALEPGPLDRPTSRAAALDRLGAGLEAIPSDALASWLVDRAAAEGGALDGAATLRLARTPGVVDAIRSLLDSGIDFGDFDAPGEGSLPAWWAVVAFLAGCSPLEACSLVSGVEADVDIIAELLSLTWTTATSEEDRDSFTVESAAHGLHDGVVDAYGGQRVDDSTF